MLSRRGFLGGLIAAPAIVKATSLMPVRGLIMAVDEPLLVKGTERVAYQLIDYRLLGGLSLSNGDWVISHSAARRVR